jgi:hypothetical protein
MLRSNLAKINFKNENNIKIKTKTRHDTRAKTFTALLTHGRDENVHPYVCPMTR